MSLVLEPYSDKSFVVYGQDIGLHYFKLQSLGGTHNAHLRVGPGFIFPNFRRPDVEAFLRSFMPKPPELTPEEKLFQAATTFYHQAQTLIPPTLQVLQVPGGRRYQYVLTYAGPEEAVTRVVAEELQGERENAYYYNKRKYLDITTDTNKRLVRYVGSTYVGD